MQAAKVSNDPSFSLARPIFHNLPNLPVLHILSNLTSPSHPSPHFPIRSKKYFAAEFRMQQRVSQPESASNAFKERKPPTPRCISVTPVGLY